MSNNFFFFSKIVPFMGQYAKLLESGGRPQIAIQYGACSWHAGQLRLQTHKLRIGNIYYFSTAALVARTRLNVTLYVHCLFC